MWVPGRRIAAADKATQGEGVGQATHARAGAAVAERAIDSAAAG